MIASGLVWMCYEETRPRAYALIPRRSKQPPRNGEQMGVWPKSDPSHLVTIGVVVIHTSIPSVALLTQVMPLSLTSTEPSDGKFQIKPYPYIPTVKQQQ